MASCVLCAFYRKPAHKEVEGRCHRYPPRPASGQSHSFVWPYVSTYAWCGEFKEKEAADEQDA